MKYDVDYFIKKFEAIPRNKWIIKAFNYGGKSCALGHCGYHKQDKSEGVRLVRLFVNYAYDVIAINDGIDSHFKQKTPKGRILAALKQIKEMK